MIEPPKKKNFLLDLCRPIPVKESLTQEKDIENIFERPIEPSIDLEREESERN